MVPCDAERVCDCDRDLELNSNQLNGTIPETLGSLKRLM
jgi:hypothetical protein